MTAGDPTPSLMKQLGLVFAAGMSQMLVVIDYTATAVALPSMARDFDVSAQSLQWVITGYVLSFSAVLAVAGPLGDRFGRKRLLLVGIVAFGGCSAWVGAADSVAELVISRIALGIGGGLLFPLSAAVVGAEANRDTLPRLMSFLTGVATIGMAVGPVVGGVFTELVDWRWVFYVNIPISMVAIVLIMVLSDESRDPEASGRIDIPGVLLLLIAIGGLSIAVSFVAEHPWPVWGGIGAASLLFTVLFVVRELTCRSPIIDLRLMNNRTFAGYLLGGGLSNSCWCVLVFATTLYLQEVRKEDPMTAGLQFLYMSVPVAVAGFLGPVVQRRVGTRSMLIIATAIQTAACVVFWISDLSPWLAIGLLVVGFGCSWGWSMSQAGGIATIPSNKVGLASGSLLTGMVLGANIAVVISATVIRATGGEDMTDYGPGVTSSYLFALGLAAAALVGSVLVIPRGRPASIGPEITAT